MIEIIEIPTEGATFEYETLSDGTPCVLARDMNEPECKAHGATAEEALAELKRLRPWFREVLKKRGVKALPTRRTRAYCYTERGG